ncbi:NADH:flavin oxidoreductase [Clostridium sp. DJ247]|uniref:NADH:flavin oxidoreductase n=1 Tax=Clostridium sp. DJ247 TaxID=2726188 RepID=UPI00162368F9|nr:NADH:flavin oxidoreductase [Clostridium sp. DJ247]MBC2578833.1 NADH:flavin oxidoreductase [Clostridium sp. DJ247]
MSTLFSEININNLRIKNRIVMPPMVTFIYAKEDGTVTDAHVKHYEERAKGGVGLIITEATSCVKGNDVILRLWSDKYIEGFRRISDICHKHGAKVLVQLAHAGLKAARNSPKDDIVSSSDYYEVSKVDNSVISARGLTVYEIHSLQQAFIDTAARAKKAGYDGIELHGAHGYLINQFLSPAINKRTDLYGGSVPNRTRFVTEIIRGIKKTLGNDFIISCRIGCNDPDLQTSIKTAKELEKAGVDLLHISSGMFLPPEIDSSELPQVPDNFSYNWIVYSGTEIRKNVNIPVIVVNNIKTPEQASFLIENDLADFVAIGKNLLVDAEWVNKAKQNNDISLCLNCKVCAWFNSEKSCPGKSFTRKFNKK